MKNHELAHLIRHARYEVLADSEAWASMVQAFEFVGRALAPEENKNGNGLGCYRVHMIEKIEAYYVEMGDDRSVREASVEFSRILELRNDAVHNGANARNLAHTCLSFGCKLEEALMGNSEFVSGVMVSNPVFVSEDDPVALARRFMVINSFTSIPVQTKEGKWKLLSDSKVARFKAAAGKNRGREMFRTIADAFSDKNLLPFAEEVESSATLDQIWARIDSGLVVVLENGRLVGVVTAFDLL